MKKSHHNSKHVHAVYFFYIDNLIEKLQYSQYVFYFIFFCKAKFSLHHSKLKFLGQFGKINLKSRCTNLCRLHLLDRMMGIFIV
jgi:hypothetical protein